MNICIPVLKNDGLKSAVSSHFGSAPVFLVVDTETDACRAVDNRDAHHSHGMCQPLASLNGESIDAIVVGGIGAGAISKLQASGIEVFLAEPGTASDIVSAFKAGKLEKATPATACAHHAGYHTDASAP
jgi:predicted Fe-Mo cluster-binding NifX family protein